MDWHLRVVVVPVSDVDRAKRFYAEQVGFRLDHDRELADGLRVVQLTPPGSACSIAFAEGLFAAPPGAVQGMQLTVSDIDAAREELLGRGVEVSEVEHLGKGGDWSSWAFFCDPDGNGWAIQQR